jgi:hypothetical protein
LPSATPEIKHGVSADVRLLQPHLMARTCDDHLPRVRQQAHEVFVDQMEEGVRAVAGEQQRWRGDAPHRVRRQLGKKLACRQHQIPLVRVPQRVRPRSCRHFVPRVWIVKTRICQEITD